MVKYLFILIMVLVGSTSFGQAYQPMPTDSATWRYRTLIVDDNVNVSDFILYQNGQDTAALGNTYLKLFYRGFNQTGPIGFNPPIVSVNAGAPDTYYGAIRESGKKVYFLSGSSEQLIFDFNAVAGSYIPGSVSTMRVVSIDSILIGSIYHKRYKTTDSTYYVIEGVGSSRGLIPALSDGSGMVVFHCFNHVTDTWTPNASTGCTSVYPYAFGNSVKDIDISGGLKIYPNPATDVLHIVNALQSPLEVVILNTLGQTIWKGEINRYKDVQVDRWPRGIYYLRSGNADFTFPAVKVSVK